MIQCASNLQVFGVTLFVLFYGIIITHYTIKIKKLLDEASPKIDRIKDIERQFKEFGYYMKERDKTITKL